MLKGVRSLPELVDKVAVDRVGDDLRAHIDSHSPKGHYKSRVSVHLSYDSRHDSYVYEIKTILRRLIFPIRGWNYSRKRLTHPPTNYTSLTAILGAAGKKWKWCLYTDRTGGWSKVPLHYLMTPDKIRLYFPRGGARIVFFSTPQDDCLVVELKGLCSLNSWAYLSWDLQTIRLFHPYGHNLGHDTDRLHAHYCVFRRPGSYAAGILPRSRGYSYTQREIAEYNRPRFERGRTSDFEMGIDLSKPDQVGYWQVFGDISRTEWHSGDSHSGSRSIRCGGRKEQVSCYWEVALHTGVYPVVEPGKRYAVSCFVKTMDLVGEGAYLSCVLKKSQKEVMSKKITGTRQWQEIRLNLDSISQKEILQIRLVHHGKGISYFDDVRFEEVK